MKLIHVLSIAIVATLFQLPTNAAVPKTELQQRITTRSQAALMQQLPKTGKVLSLSEKASFETKIATRAQFFASAVDALPMRKVDEKLSRWIEDSFVSEVRGLGLSFLNQPPSDDALVVYKKDIEERFKTLSNAKGLRFLSKKDVYLQAARTYHTALRTFIVRNLSSPRTLQLKHLHGLQLDNFVKALKEARESDEDPNYIFKGLVNDELNLTNSNIDSNIMCLNVARQVEQALDIYARIDWFNFASIVSPVYSENQEVKLAKVRTFAQVQPEADKVFASCLKISGTTAQFDLVKFRSVLNTINELRYDVKGKFAFEVTTAFDPTVTFKNCSQSWQTIVTEPHFLSGQEVTKQQRSSKPKT